MDTVFKKMNFKGHKNIVVINAPQSFETNIAAMEGLTTFARDFKTAGETDYIIAFCTKQSEVDAVALEAAKILRGDGLLWYAYPKGSSKRYKCEFNRDNGWAIVGEQGFEPVRQVAIDEDWSALRFRKVGFIKTMTRSFAMTDEGKKKVEK